MENLDKMLHLRRSKLLGKHIARARVEINSVISELNDARLYAITETDDKSIITRLKVLEEINTDLNFLFHNDIMNFISGTLIIPDDKEQKEQ